MTDEPDPEDLAAFEALLGIQEPTDEEWRTANAEFDAQFIETMRRIDAIIARRLTEDN